MGPPGCQKAENAKMIADHFNWKPINVGSLLKMEVEKKTELGAKILNASKKYHYVDDSIVCDLVAEKIRECEEKSQSWCLQGFPRTKVQALSLQKMGIIPDRMILLKIKPAASLGRIKNNLIQITPQLYGNELEDLAAQCLQEYELNLKGVREAFNQFIFEHDASEKAQSDVVNDLMKLLELRYKNNAPRRPPRIIIAGPPGSGKETQAAALSRVYGLVHVSTKKLLKKEIH